ncbi:MAG: Tox-REase-5 domain-containing protein [Planctomycetota bacterium]|nr:Tox-REase-5 domain-containing protein [Planctomycetota bacterium]
MLLPAVMVLGAVVEDPNSACWPGYPVDSFRLSTNGQIDSDWPSHDADWVEAFLTTVAHQQAIGGADPCADSAGIVVLAGDRRRWRMSLASGSDALGPSPCVAQMLRTRVSAMNTGLDDGFALTRSDWFESWYWAMRHDLAATPESLIGRRGYSRDPFGVDGVANPVVQMSPGDFLPMGATLVANTEPLIPPGMRGADTGWNGVSRPVLDGVVDLVTGLPTVKVTDLELPFGGSTFRLIRTRSGRSRFQTPAGVIVENAGAGENFEKVGSHWNWTGLGWMASENPILLIDSTIPDIVGDAPATCYFIPDATRSIPFQKLATTAQTGPSSVRYEAPPRFRSTLRGVSSAEGGRFADGLFDEYEVTTLDGELTYRFVTVREPLPTQTSWKPWVDGGLSLPASFDGSSNWQRLSMHAAPDVRARDVNGESVKPQPFDSKRNAGLGVPYYALCTRITDRYGHEVRIDYCESVSRSLGNDDGACACQRDCLAIGQIKTVKLVAKGSQASDDRVVWTLLYAHRRFGGLTWSPANYDIVTNATPEQDPGRYSLHGYNMIDRIYVYEGDIPDAVLTNACLTNPWNAKAEMDDGSGVIGDRPDRSDALARHNETLPTDDRIRTDWRYVISYNYATRLHDNASDGVALNNPDLPETMYQWCSMQSRLTKGVPLSIPVLIGTTVRMFPQPNEGMQARETARRRVFTYWYAAEDATLKDVRDFDSKQDLGTMMLRAVFEEDDIARLASASFFRTQQGSRFPGVKDLAYQESMTATTETTLTLNQIDAFASLKFKENEYGDFGDYGGTSTSGLALCPSFDALTAEHGGRPFVSAASLDAGSQLREHFRMQDQGQVGYVAIGVGSGRRFYRIMQVQVYPYPLIRRSSAATPSSLLGGLADLTGSMPSAWFSPYPWHAFSRETYHPNRQTLVDAPALMVAPRMDEPRWITIVDEFDSWATLTSTLDPGATDNPNDDINASDYKYDGNGYKPGLRSRRVVQVNAAGFVLRDKTWQFDPAQGQGTVSATQGIGPEASYQTVRDYLRRTSGATSFSEEFNTPQGTPDPKYVPKSLLDEVIYVEHRGLGWSVADVSSFGRSGPNLGETNGVVTRFHYKVFPPNPMTDDPRQWQGRLQQIAQSIAKGTGPSSGAGADGSPGGIDYYTSQTVRDEASPRDVKAQIQFTTPYTQLLTANSVPALGTVPPEGIVMTWFQTIRDMQNRIVATGKVESPRRLRPGGAWYYPVDRQVMNKRGQAVWSVNGLVRDPSSPAPNSEDNQELQSLFFSYSRYDTSGRLIASVADTTPGTAYRGPQVSSSSTPIGASGTVPAYGESETSSSDDAEIDPSSGIQSWARIPASGTASNAALNYTTVYEYDGDRLRDVFFPSAALGNSPGQAGAKRQAVREIVYDPDPDVAGEWDAEHVENCERVERYTFNNLVAASSVAGAAALGNVVTQSLAECAIYAGKTVEGSPVRVEKGRINGAFNPDALPSTIGERVARPANLPFEMCAGVEIARDSKGKINNVSEMEWDNDQQAWTSLATQINDLGEMYRELTPDGTITRKTKDSLGHHMRTYIGTADDGWGPRGVAVGTVNGSIAFNMILTERLEYGSGIHDAWLPVVHRRYASNAGNEWAFSNFYGTPAADRDLEGIATVTKYDWRMRPVLAISYAKGALTDVMPPRTGTTITYLDFLGRPVLVASYGAGMPPSAIPDPSASDLGPNWMPPSLASPSTLSVFYPTAGQAPLLSLVGSIFGPDGGVVETRRFDIAPLAQQGDNPRWQSEYRYAGLGGKEVFSRRPSAPVTVTTLDALGRTASVKTVAPNNSSSPYGHELARSESIYDADGNVIEEIRYERTVHENVGPLRESGNGTVANALVSRTYSWYDTENRRVAWAEMPTESAAPPMTGAGTSRPAPPPMWNNQPALPSILMSSIKQGVPDLAAARVSLQMYDNAGLVKTSISPSGAVTRNLYDKGNRLVAKGENIYSGLSSGASTLPDARLTRYEYKLGKLKAIIAPGALASSGGANADMPITAREGNGDQRTVVTYGADVVAPVPGSSTEPPTYALVSRNNSIVGAMRLPNPVTGGVAEASDPASITLRYTFSGQIAERVDARGCAFRYFYDDQDRFAQIEIGESTIQPAPSDAPAGTPSTLKFVAGYPGGVSLPGLGAPVDRVGFIEYSYDAAGRMSEAKAYVQRGGLLISHNKFAYDSRGNLIKDAQSHGREITSVNAAATPATTYEWEYAPTGPTNLPAETGFNRLLKIGYPAQPNAPPNSQPRSLSFSYGSANSSAGSVAQVNHVLARIDTITSSKAPLDIAAFDYTGTDRRVGTTFAGGGLSVTLRGPPINGQPSPTLAGLDGFGRIRDLHYVNSQIANGQKQTLFRAEYGYDLSGNRLSQRTTRVDSAGLPIANFNSQSHQYDGLDRLIGSRVGTLDASGVVPEAPPGSSGSASAPFRFDTWTLDALGNPNGRFGTGTIGGSDFVFTTPGRASGGNLDAFGTPWASVLMAPADVADDASTSTWQTDRRNRLTQLERVSDVPGIATSGNGSGGGVGSTWPFSRVQPRYDAAGNCTFDGSYFYQYDAWNRLVQINAIAAQQIAPDGEGNAAPLVSPNGLNWGVGTPTDTTANAAPGLLVKHFTYDALGRLIRTQSPWPSPQEPDGTVRTEKFYYDGVRRVQEVIVDPVRIIDLEGEGGVGDFGDGDEITPAMRALAQQHGGDGSAAAIAGQGQSPTNVDGSSSTSSFENAQTNTGGANNVTTITGGNVGGIELSNAWLSREYVWGPGGSFVGAPVDELLVQVDGEGRAAWAMQDAGGDVVAVAVNSTGSGAAATSATGNAASATGTSTVMRVAAQQEYGPYGEVVWAEHLLNHPAIHAGHKGLFVDRLDLGISDGSGGLAATAKTFGEPPRIVPLAFNLAQNRNRTLHVGMQRYLQLDPNASGMNTLGGEMMGVASRMTADAMELKASYADGANVYAYQIHNPWTKSDPLGLFDEGLDGGIDLALNFIPNPLVETYARTGVMAMRMGRDLVDGYSQNLSADVEWATDWSLPDDMHSRNDASWVNNIVRGHLQSFVDNIDPIGPAYAGTAGSGALGARVSKFWADGPGVWFKPNRSMPEESRLYQNRITKKPDIEYRIGNIEFDGYSKGGVFLEAKANYAHLMDKPFWGSIEKGFLEQAERQINAINEAVGPSGRLVWHIKEPVVYNKVKKLFRDNGIRAIVVLTE